MSKLQELISINDVRIKDLNELWKCKYIEKSRLEFWASQLSAAAKACTCSKLDDLPDNLLWLDAVRRKFDEISK